MKKSLVLAATLLFCIASIGAASAQSNMLTGYSGSYSKPVVADGIVYIVSPSRLYTLNATDGAKLWTIGTHAIPQWDNTTTFTSLPVVIGQICYVTSSTNWILPINITFGMPEKLIPFEANKVDCEGNLALNLESIIENAPTTVGDITYSVTASGVVSATLSDNTQLWMQDINGAVYVIKHGSTIYDANSVIQYTQPTPKPTATPAPTVAPKEAEKEEPSPTPIVVPLEAHNSEPMAVHGNMILGADATTVSYIALVIASIAVAISVALIVMKYKPKIDKK